MFDPRHISIAEYTYLLPDERIARYPLASRHASKLLVYTNGSISDSSFSNIANHVPEGSLLVSNNSRVIPARMFFRKETGAVVEIFCLEPIEPSDYQQSFASSSTCVWKCIVGNLKKWKAGKLVICLGYKGEELRLEAEVVRRLQNEQEVRFSWGPGAVDFATVIELVGQLPIPPYLERDTEDIDIQHYQTIYSKVKGSVAAPTAGLHFTSEVFDTLRARGCTTAELTLHVGAGTFKPVKAATLGDHPMHREHFSVDKPTVELLLANLGKIVAVGTTSTRAMESLYQVGVQLQHQDTAQGNCFCVDQWQPYHERQNMTTREALNNIVRFFNTTGFSTLQCYTSILIVPGYTFRVVDRLITNFHQPQSTLILLVAAFVGQGWKDIYQHALQHGYRFLSYGDSSILERNSKSCLFCQSSRTS